MAQAQDRPFDILLQKDRENGSGYILEAK